MKTTKNIKTIDIPVHPDMWKKKEPIPRPEDHIFKPKESLKNNENEGR